MATIYRTVCEIAGTDYGAGGNGYLRRLRVAPGPGGGVVADIWLEIPAGVGYSFKPKEEVRVWYQNVANGNLGGRYLGGFVRDRKSGKVAGGGSGANRIVRLVAETYATELDHLVGSLASSITLNAGTVGSQVSQLLAAVNGGASRTINYTIQGSGAFTTTVLPIVRFTGRTFRYMLERILANLDAAVSGARSRYHMGLDATTGAVAFGEPRLYVYDAAAPPPPGAATWNFSDTPGAAKPMFDPFWNEHEGGGIVNKLQSVMAFDGTVSTATDGASMTAYPNPFSPGNNWQGEPFVDRESMSAGAAASLLARKLALVKDPALLVSFRTDERVLPYDWVQVTWVSDGLAGAWYQVVGMDLDFAQANDPWGELLLSRDGGVSVSFPPSGPPDKPTGLTALYKGPSQDGERGVLNLGWTAPTDSTYVAYYEVCHRIDINKDGTTYTSWSEPVRVLSAVLDVWMWSLALEERYEFRVRGVDNFGKVGDWSTTLVETVAAPVYDALPNPGFEVARAVKSQHPDAWPLASGVAADRVALDSAEAYQGGKSLKLLATVPASAEVDSRKLLVNTSRQYLVRFFAKSDNAGAANFNLKASWYDKAGGLISASDVIASSAVPAAWTEQAAKLTPPANAARLVISPRVAAGTVYNVWLDGFSFAPLVEAADVRDTSITLAKLAARGQALPGSPSVGDEFYRTDLGRWCYWDGANWLGPVALLPYVWRSGALMPLQVANAPAYVLAAAIDNTYAWKVVKSLIAMFVVTTNDGSNYWKAELRKDGTLVGSTQTTASGGPDAWIKRTEGPVSTNIATSYSALEVYVDYVGTPGGLYISALTYVREVIA